MDTVAVISASGKKLMPTNSYRARRLLKSKRAVIYRYRPAFTIKLVDRTNGYTQPIEYKCDTGYQNIGISICSDTKEFVNEQRDLYSAFLICHTDDTLTAPDFKTCHLDFPHFVKMQDTLILNMKKCEHTMKHCFGF